MFGRLVAGLIVIGLAFGVWIVWPRAEDEPAPTTQNVTSSTTSIATTSTTRDETTTTPAPTAEVIETVEQAEDLLKQFWFGWFEGIYNRDEDRIKEVVASQGSLDSARNQFDVMEFDGPPNLAGISVANVEILRADEECTAIWATVSFTFRGGASTTGVTTFRTAPTEWKSVNSWLYQDDLWEQDCDAQLEPLS